MSHVNTPFCSAVQDLYPGDGVQFDFPLTFEYDASQPENIHVALYNPNTLEYDDIEEFEAGVAAGNYYKFVNATTIRFVDENDATIF